MHVVMVVPMVAPVMVMPVMVVLPVMPVMAVLPVMPVMATTTTTVTLAGDRLVGDFLGDQRLLGRGLRHVRGHCGRCQQSRREQRG
jgi:hypothetical protein